MPQKHRFRLFSLVHQRVFAENFFCRNKLIFNDLVFYSKNISKKFHLLWVVAHALPNKLARYFIYGITENNTAIHEIIILREAGRKVAPLFSFLVGAQRPAKNEIVILLAARPGKARGQNGHKTVLPTETARFAKPLPPNITHSLIRSLTQ
ncbi:MAG: hypothetical protein ACK4Q5_20920 [Saprospiraceae bacterium]